MNSEARIQELEARIEELTALVQRIAPAMQPAAPGEPATLVPSTAGVDMPEVVAPTSSRRNMLKLAGAAAAGATAIAIAGHASPVAAADGGPLLIGTSNSGTADTILTGKMWALADSANTADILTGISGTIIGWDVSNSAASSRAGVVGYSGPFFSGGNTPHGVMGIVAANAATGSGVYGRSNSDLVGQSPGVRALSDNGPSVQMVPVFAAAPTSGTWTRGALLPDTSGNLWYCVTSGSPGTWRKLGGASTAGAFHALSPGRVYDSRAALPFQGALVGGNNRTITVADKRNTTTGAVTTADFVPAGATAVAANITIVSLSGAGFLTVNPGGDTSVGSSTINWSAPGQVLANGVTLTLDTDRQLTIVAGGGGSTEFIVDISGYYL